MRISAVTLNGVGGWPTLEWSGLIPGLNVVYGPTGSGKTTLAELLAQALYGQPPSVGPGSDARPVPDGEVIVEGGEAKYRLRRCGDDARGVRLTVSGLDGAAVDRQTVRRMLGGWTPAILRRLCAINFREPPVLAELLSAEFAREYQAIGLGSPIEGSRRVAELLARRDTLAKELETRLAGEGRASRELDARRRELDRLIGEAERELAALDSKRCNIEAALTETDTRLRYRRLELNVDQTWRVDEPADWEAQLAELDEQIARWRGALAELAGREATVRSRLAQLQTGVEAAVRSLADDRAWLSVARQLSFDLAGEVARLARASASNECVCRDAHPRLRPIVETLQRQLDVLAKQIDERQQQLEAEALADEAIHLARSQSELTRQLEYLVQRRQTIAHGVLRSQRGFERPKWPAKASAGASGPSTDWITAADAEQLEQRRLELEQERFDAAQRLATHDRKLRDLRAQRTTVDRQRAALLSARSIEHIQRELSAVQQKLQQSVPEESAMDAAVVSAGNSLRASDILAQLTDRRLTRMQLVDGGRRATVWTRDGATSTIESLTPSERDQVCLSLSIALLSAASGRCNVQVPMLLDEPFARIETGQLAALAAVLNDSGRRGQQILLFTGNREAAERLASLGAPLHDIHALRRHGGDVAPVENAARTKRPTAIRPVARKKVKSARKLEHGKRAKKQAPGVQSETPGTSDRSDAA